MGRRRPRSAPPRLQPLCLAGISHSHSLTDSCSLYRSRLVYIQSSLSQSVGRSCLSQPNTAKGCFPQAGAETRATTRRSHLPSLAFLAQAGLKHCSNQSTQQQETRIFAQTRPLSLVSRPLSFSRSRASRLLVLVVWPTSLHATHRSRSSLGPPVRVCHAHPYSPAPSTKRLLSNASARHRPDRIKISLGRCRAASDRHHYQPQEKDLRPGRSGFPQ